MEHFHIEAPLSRMVLIKSPSHRIPEVGVEKRCGWIISRVWGEIK
jgi:hypothetical protein